MSKRHAMQIRNLAKQKNRDKKHKLQDQTSVCVSRTHTHKTTHIHSF